MKAITLALLLIPALFAGSDLENWFGDNTQYIVGEPFVAGIIFIGFFVGFLFIQNVGLDAKVAILIPALLLSMIFIPWLAVLLALGVGVVVYLALTKFTNR
jgi:hypothetical protein